MISSLPWHEAFYKLLNHAAELTLSSDAGELERFLDACYNAQVRIFKEYIYFIFEFSTGLLLISQISLVLCLYVLLLQLHDSALKSAVPGNYEAKPGNEDHRDQDVDNQAPLDN